MTASSLYAASSSSPAHQPRPVTNSGSGQWLNVMVEFAHSPASDEQNLTRGELYRRRRADAQRHRQELEAWLQREGMAGEVKEFGEVTAFDLLFAIVTPQAAAALHHAPDVVAVTPVD